MRQIVRAGGSKNPSAVQNNGFLDELFGASGSEEETNKTTEKYLSLSAA